MTTPPHYIGNGKITCKDAMDSMMYGLHYKGAITYWWGCAFKYLWRWPYKGVREDLEKQRRVSTIFWNTCQEVRSLDVFPVIRSRFRFRCPRCCVVIRGGLIYDSE